MGVLSDLREEINALASCYPRFVTAAAQSLTGQEVPVFVHHTIDAIEFERQLQFLRENRYRTINADEFVSQMLGRRKGSSRDVLLTIDDARSSAWRYGYPLLEKYACHAVLFAIPGWTPDTGKAMRSNLNDVWAGKTSEAEVASVDANDLTVCSWAELRAMSDSGVIDVHSHSWSHRRAFTGLVLREFFLPNQRYAPFSCPFNPYLNQHSPFTAVRAADYFGLPLFAARSVLGGGPFFKLAPAAIEDIRNEYQSSDAAGDGSRRLERRLRIIVANQGEKLLEPVSVTAARAEAEFEIMRSREALAERLGTRPHFLCLPFGEGDATTGDLVRRLGVVACFWSIRQGRSTNMPGDELDSIVRVKSDFLWRLPGQGNKSLLSVYASKAMRRLRGKLPY